MKKFKSISIYFFSIFFTFLLSTVNLLAQTGGPVMQPLYGVQPGYAEVGWNIFRMIVLPIFLILFAVIALVFGICAFIKRRKKKNVKKES